MKRIALVSLLVVSWLSGGCADLDESQQRVLTGGAAGAAGGALIGALAGNAALGAAIGGGAGAGAGFLRQSQVNRDRRNFQQGFQAGSQSEQ